MKKIVACLAISALLMSFQTVAPKVFHYPSFMMVMSNSTLYGKPIKVDPTYHGAPFPVLLVTEGYCNGVFVAECNDYLQGIDSIATKHDQWISNSSPKGSYVVYDNFYSRAGNGKWKKYDSKKRLVGIITEIRTDTISHPYNFPQGRIVYYAVR